MSEFGQENEKIEDHEEKINSIENKVANLLRQNPDESPDKIQEILHEKEIAWEDVRNVEAVLEELSEHEKKVISDMHEKIRRMARYEDNMGDYWKKLTERFDNGDASEVEIIDKVETSIEDLEKEADELEKIAHIAEIVSREIRKAGNYTLQLSELEKQLLTDNLEASVKRSNFSHGHDILETIESDIEGILFL